ncbi:hypothetical protein LI82_06770 [Methanococcoides methylutens]|uniref:Cardiolipin synthase N-terminal domain-containing protein n=1 Tax=Methanococcoides methylutens TaxID=2226 RepID=A0A099T0Z3_METMT|nr:DUF1673 family protein [Methanococcoides methylutens]KGK98569.1 hypothetical protein LI82_06770 [Methanococcoides methylutens]
MTINVAETIRRIMGWCPNANMGRLKSSQQIDFANTSLKPSGKVNKRNSEWTIVGLIVFFAIFVFTFHIGQLLWGIIAMALVFWFFMLADCLQRSTDRFPGKGEYDKLIWSAVLIILNFIGAVLYYYLVKIQENKTNLQN